MSKLKFTANYSKKPWRGGVVEVAVPDFKNPLRIDVYPKTEVAMSSGMEEITHYTVNWAALGSVPAASAKLYAKAITKAATVAHKLTEKFRGKEHK